MGLVVSPAAPEGIKMQQGQPWAGVGERMVEGGLLPAWRVSSLFSVFLLLGAVS